MRNFILILIVIVLIPMIWMMGIQGLSFNEMLLRLGLKKEEGA